MRTRPIIDNNTLKTDNCELLRGVSMFSFEQFFLSGDLDYTTDPDFFAELATNGINAIRIVHFDPWKRSEGSPTNEWWDYTVTQDRIDSLKHMSEIVDLCEAFNMYAIINYHDVLRLDGTHANEFWQVAAPKYANREHVIYEIVNEPVPRFSATYADSTVIAEQETMYQTIRAIAPVTPIIVQSFNQTSNTFGGETMVAATDLFSINNIVNFNTDSNLLVGFHAYDANPVTSEEIVNLKADYPAIMTEGYWDPTNVSPSIGQYDGDFWWVETMERLDISWFFWLAFEGPDTPVPIWNTYFKGQLVPDAKTNGNNTNDFYWGFDNQESRGCLSTDLTIDLQVNDDRDLISTNTSQETISVSNVINLPFIQFVENNKLIFNSSQSTGDEFQWSIIITVDGIASPPIVTGFGVASSPLLTQTIALSASISVILSGTNSVTQLEFLVAQGDDIDIQATSSVRSTGGIADEEIVNYNFNSCGTVLQITNFN